MREIVDGIKVHMNYRSDAQAADFLGISRQHLHISITNNKLMPERMLEVCISNGIDITRLLRDGRATALSEVDYSDTEVPIAQYREGEISPFSKKSFPKWFAEIVFRRKIGLNEVLGMVQLDSDELEPKIQRDSVIYIDTMMTTPIGGMFYVEVDGYGTLRRLSKSSQADRWHLTAGEEYSMSGDGLLIHEEFNIIGRCQFTTTRM